MITHLAPISGIAANSEFVATAGYDNQLLLWDPSRRQVVARGVHDHLVNHCAFSPDGFKVASASSDYTARLWSVPDLTLLAVLGPHDDDVEMVAFSPAGDRVATACRDYRIRVFDLTGKLLATMHGHQADVISVAWSADSRTLTSSSDDGTIRVWDSKDGALRGLINMAGVETDTVVVCPDETIYAGDDDGCITTVRAGAVSRKPAHNAGIKRLILGPRRLVSLSYDRTLCVWDIGADCNLTLFLRTQMPSEVWPRSCAFVGEQLVFGTFGTAYASFDLATTVWDLSGVDQTAGVNAVTLHDDAELTVGDAGTVRRAGSVVANLGSCCNFLTPFGGTVLTGGQMGRVFDALTGRVLHTHHSPLNCGATFNLRGEPKAVIGTYTGEGLLFRMGVDGAPEFERCVPLHKNAIKGVAYAGTVIFSVSATGAAACHSAIDFEVIALTERGHDKIANGCTALATGGFASVSRDRKLRTWDIEGRVNAVIPTPHTHSIKCIASSPDGRYIATGAYNGRVAVYDNCAHRWTVDRRLTSWGISSLSASRNGFTAGAYDGHTYSIEL